VATPEMMKCDEPAGEFDATRLFFIEPMSRYGIKRLHIMLGPHVSGV